MTTSDVGRVPGSPILNDSANHGDGVVCAVVDNCGERHAIEPHLVAASQSPKLSTSAGLLSATAKNSPQ